MGISNWFQGTYLATHLEVGRYTRRRNSTKSGYKQDLENVKQYIGIDMLPEKDRSNKLPRRPSSPRSKEKQMRDIEVFKNYVGMDLLPGSRKPGKSSSTPNRVSRQRSYEVGGSNEREINNQYETTKYRSNSYTQPSTSSEPNNNEFQDDFDSYFTKSQGRYHGSKDH